MESDIWWTPSSHRAREGRYDMHVWRMSLKEWGWNTTSYQAGDRQREDIGSGIASTLDEAKAAAIHAATLMRRE